MNRYIFANKNMKAMDLQNPIRDSWDFVEAMKTTGDVELYASVAAVNRAMNLTADAIANMPFAVLNEKGEEVDSSAQWRNVIGIMPHPREMLRLWRLSLFQTNKAYGRIVKTKPGKKELFYVEPSTIEPVTDEKNGELLGFVRKLNGIVVAKYAIDDPSFVWMWRLDHTTELLPSPHTEFKALSKAAGILYAADWWTENYFSNGAVKPTLISIKGMVIGDKRDELENRFSKFMRGIGKAWGDLAKVINGETMDVKTIGDGLGDIKDSPVYKQAIENIAIASGIPLSLLLSNSANYATAQTEKATWFNDSVVPWALWMQEGLNASLFQPKGLYFEFRPEASEPSQEDEVARAGAFSTYVNAGMKPSLAAQIVGIDLPAGYEYEDLDEDDEPAEETPADTTQDMVEGEDDSEDMTEDTYVEQDMSMDVKAWDELETWKRKALRHAKREQDVNFEFVTEHLPASVSDTIRERLSHAEGIDEVKAAFEVGNSPTKAEGYKPPEAVQRAARRGLELRKKHGKGGLDREEASNEGVGSGVQRATNLANGDSVSLETIRRMAAFFSRHEKNKEGGEDDAGYIAWQLWGGDAGRSWANGILRDVDGEDKSIEIKALADAINKLAEEKPEVKAEPMQVNVTMPSITLNAQMPAQDTPTVTVNIPEQIAPVVTVNVPEQPAPVVNVQNNMPPAEVTVNAEVITPERKPLTAELTTDPHTGKKVLKAK